MHYMQYPTALDLLALHHHHPAFFPGLLQSSQDEGWDILFALPETNRLFYARDSEAFFETLADIAVPDGASSSPEGTPPFPFYGGWFIYAGYELLHTIEPSVARRELDDSTPVAALIRIPAAVLYQRATKTTWLVTETKAQLTQLQQRMQPLSVSYFPLQVMSLDEEPAEIFLHGVARCKQYILDGDVFQVNLSRAWNAVLHQRNTAVEVYHQLRLANPAPFSACMKVGDLHIISSSPERLVRIKQGWVEVRPIAGTHPRAETLAEDAILKAKLMNSVKERAEHIMLIDLERNDLGRICRPGTVEVNELMSVASYTHVHHIESNIRGRLRAGLTMKEVLYALFPGGTITGCPKVRTMQIIRELETQPRLAYTGSLGYINKDGTMDLNILIRSFIKQESQLSFRAGAGIVADSIPEHELQETRAKAKGLLRALGLSV